MLSWQHLPAREQCHPVTSSVIMQSAWVSPLSASSCPGTCQVSGGDAAPALAKSASGSRPASPVASSASSSSSSSRGSAPEPGACGGCYVCSGSARVLAYMAMSAALPAMHRSYEAPGRLAVSRTLSAAGTTMAPAGWRRSRRTARVAAGPRSAAPPVPAPCNAGEKNRVRLSSLQNPQPLL